MTRPYPPVDMLTDPDPRFVPAPDLEQWARQSFINELSPLHNEEHVHLQIAEIGFVWSPQPRPAQSGVSAAERAGWRAVRHGAHIRPELQSSAWAARLQALQIR